ncbi:MAG: hypothetical protein JXR78_15300 [Victivallales bacterium]|nr:hypothetical protein [Victivallales bacterium]
MLKVYDDIFEMDSVWRAQCHFCGKKHYVRKELSRQEAKEAFLECGLRKVETEHSIGDMCEECREEIISEEGIAENIL